jgi:hypothetical protein
VAFLAGDGLERGQPLRGGVGPVAFVLLERDLLDARLARGLVLHDLLGRHGDDLGVEAARLLSGGGALLADQRVLVLRLARDVVARGDGFRGEDHRHVDVGLVLVEPLVVQPVRVEVLVLHEADRLQPARDDDGHLVDDHPLRRHRDRLHARGAEPVDGDAGGGHRQAGAQGGLPRDVLAGGAFGQRAAHDDVLDLTGLEAGPLDRFRDHVTAHRGAVRVVEGATVRLADRGARGGDDDGVSHEGSPWGAQRGCP